MPNWKKVIVSGSNAVLNNITASGHMTVLDGGFTANNAASTELEVVGDISASGTITCDTIVASNLNFGDDFSYTNLSIEDEINTLHATTNEHSAHLLKLKNTSDTVETFAGISFDVGSEDDADSIAASIKAVNASFAAGVHGAHLVFSTNNAGDDGCTERMRITSGGFVGIGDFDTVAQPLQNLHIKGSSAQMIFEENTTDYLRIGTGMTDKDSFIGFDDTNMLHIGTFAGISDTSMNTKLLISQTGLVGIGNDVLDPPINRLHVRHGGVDGDNGIVLTRNDGTVSVNETLGGIGFDSEDGGTQSSVFEASAYIAGFASQTHTGTERGGYLTLGTKAINANVNVNAIERMRITDSGRIGIGTGTPMNILQVNNSGSDSNNGIMLVRADSTTVANNLLGGIGFDSTDGNVPSSILEASAYIAGYAAETQAATDKGGYLTFGTALINDDDDTVSTERMRITDSGRIGIGTGTPMNKLQIGHNGSDFNNGLMIVRIDGTTSTNELLGGIGFDSTDGNVPSSILEASAYIAGHASEAHGTGDKGGYLVFGTTPNNDDDDTTSDERMRITDSGRIGIGTTTPLNKFQIDHDGSDSNNGMMIVRADASTNAGDLLGGIGFDSTDGLVPSSVLEASAYIASYAAEGHSTSDKGGHLAFGTTLTNDNDDTVSHERMRITDEGVVLIGPSDIMSDTSVSALKVSGSNNAIALRVQPGNSATFDFRGNSTSGYTAEFDINNTGLQIGHGSSGRTFDLQTNSTNRIRIESNGQLKFYNIAASSGTNYVKWDSSTKAITYQSSTRKAKKNIVALTSESYNSILDLNPVSFTRKDDNVQYFGFIAEECADAHIRFATYGPDYVFDESGSLTPLSASLDENGAKGYQDYQLESNDQVPIALDTDAILAAAVAKIQELEARIQELES